MKTVTAFFSAFPIIWTIVQSTDVSWTIVGLFILIASGVITLVKASQHNLHLTCGIQVVFKRCFWF
jgi:hypothetical protein